MLDTVKRSWWRLRGWLAWRRHRAHVEQLAAGDPVEAHLTELCLDADERGIDALTARQQLVVRTWSAHGVIGNGGFQYLFECRLPLAPVADGYRTLGFERAAAACERVMAAVAAAPALTDEARRAAVVEGSDGDPFDAEEHAIYEVEWEELRAAIGDYMRRNPRDFPGLPPPSTRST